MFDRVIRAWRDPEFRQSLSEEEQAALPENPAGAIELTDDELEMAVGGYGRPYSSQSSSRSASSSNSQRAASSSNSQRSASSSNSQRSASSSNSSRSASSSSSQSRRRPQSQSSASSGGMPRWARRPLR